MKRKIFIVLTTIVFFVVSLSVVRSPQFAAAVGASEKTELARMADSDGDGVEDSQDNCPNAANANQANADGDLLGDVCDRAPLVPFEDSIFFSAFSSDGGGLSKIIEPYTLREKSLGVPGADFFPDYNGRKVVFVGKVEGENLEVFLMNVDGSGVTRLTDNAARDTLPTLSNDGSRIAFVSNRDGNDEIYVMNSDGSNLIRLTNNPRRDTQPAFNPAGTKIVFASSRDAADPDFESDIYKMNLDGTSILRLTNLNYGFAPSYTPVGGKIIFSREDFSDNPNSGIYTMKTDGSELTQITSSSSELKLLQKTVNELRRRFNYLLGVRAESNAAVNVCRQRRRDEHPRLVQWKCRQNLTIPNSLVRRIWTATA